MREIKFRAWDTKKNEYAPYQDLVMLFAFSKTEPNRMVYQQYTGLKDKNGTEIYEGDIVQYRDWHSNADGSTTLSKANEYMKKKVIEYSLKTPFVGFTLQDNVEVIGNIYENPDLLATEKGNQ